MTEERTSIALKRSTYERLERIAKYKDTMDEILNRLLDEHELTQQNKK